MAATTSEPQGVVGQPQPELKPRRGRKPIPEHLRVPWTVPQALGVYLFSWILLPIVLVLLVLALAPFVPVVHALLEAIRSNNVQVSVGLDMVTVAVALALVWMYLRRYKVGWKAVGWRPANLKKTILYLVGGFIAFFVLAIGLLEIATLLLPGFDPNQAQTNEITDSVKTHFGLTLLALVIVPPIIEETVFRGFIFPAISKKWGTIGGAIASSALFGLAHWQANVSIYTFALGLVLCFLYVKLKSIFPGMLVHMLNNLLAFYALTGK